MTDSSRRPAAFVRVILLSWILMPLVLGCPDLPDGEGTVPDIYINCDGMSVGMNDTVQCTATVVGETRDLVFTIENKGTADLELTGGPVILSGSETFTVQKDPSILVKPGTASTFTVRFAPVDTSGRTAAVSIASNDPDENPFTFSSRAPAPWSPARS